MKETKIIQWIVLLPIIGVILTSFLLTNIFISSINEKHDIEIANLKHQHINQLKNSIQERIDHIALLLQNSYHRQIQNSKLDINNIIDLGYKIIENLYKQNQHLDKKALFELINQQMKDIRFFKNNNGYYFIWDLKDGISISLPSAPHLVGTSLTNLIDVKGKNLFDSYGHILNQYGEGFDTWYWNKPGSSKSLEKVGYIKKFAPLNIGIGTAIYTEDIKENISKNAIESIKKLSYADESYIFILNSKGTTFHHKKESVIGVPLEQFAKKTQNIINEIIHTAKNSNGDFLEYTQPEIIMNSLSSHKKISYVKYIKELDWIIGTGLYTNTLNAEILKRTEVLKNALKNDIKTIILIAFTVSFIAVIVILLLSKQLNKRFHFYASQLEKSNQELKKVNSELEKKVEEQVSHIREKDLILNQQSKLTAMGEMIGNISHQWRQPLSAISTLASGIIVQKEMGMIKDEQLKKDLNNIVQSTQVLSHTIDDFRNFYAQDKKFSTFDINAPIQQVISLIDANLQYYDIELIQNIEDIEVTSYKNELIQVILNILNNAKDALKKKEHKRYIMIETVVDNNFITLDIFDNAGGIQEDILPKIFNPYFTTKKDEDGTGIGLYMSKNIVEKHLNGLLKVKNHDFTYKNQEYYGAKFSIVLPL